MFQGPPSEAEGPLEIRAACCWAGFPDHTGSMYTGYRVDGEAIIDRSGTSDSAVPLVVTATLAICAPVPAWLMAARAAEALLVEAPPPWAAGTPCDAGAP